MDSPLNAQTNLALLQATQLQEPTLPVSKNQARIEDAAREFEAVFVAEMMKPMFEGIEANNLFGGGKGEAGGTGNL